MLLLGRDANPTSPHIDRQSLGKQVGLPILPPLEGLNILPPLAIAADVKPCHKSTKKTVSFCHDSENEVHEFERVTAEEYEHVWYSRQHMEYFRWERKQLAKAIQRAQAAEEEENSSNSSYYESSSESESEEDSVNTPNVAAPPKSTWSQGLLQVYCAFRQYETAADVHRALRATPQMSMDEYTIGMEKCVLKPLARDFAVRRQHLCHQLAHLQQCDGFASADARAALLRDTSRLSSRAARLFAQYVAQVAYETEC